MKTLAEHTIVYDDECPLCNAYTSAFVKTGMLDSQGREAYTALNPETPNIDWQRARNEIALINNRDHSVRYGVDSLMAILGHSMPVFNPLFRSRLFRSLVNQLYFFISYNRKVIAPGKVFQGCNKCTPDLNYPYRAVYILFGWTVSSLILSKYFELSKSGTFQFDFIHAFILVGGFMVFQGIIVGAAKRDRLIHYLGNVMTVLLAGTLLLAPVFLVVNLGDSRFLITGYSMCILGLMLFMHVSRIKTLELPWFISATALVYWFLVLSTFYQG